MFDRAFSDYDAVVLSGGTSKGGGDLSYRVLEALGEIVVHGVALRPGKPLCLAAHQGKPVVILPGFPTSAIFTFHAFVAPVLRRLGGQGEHAAISVTARLARHLRSEIGRMDFTLVNLVPARDGLLAFPLGRGSGSVTTFARADGFFAIPQNEEYAEPGEQVEVTLLGRDLVPADCTVIGSHCVGLDHVLSRLAAAGTRVKALQVGSRGGLDAARQGACDVAPVHLYDRATDTYNEPFLDEGLRLLRGYGRRQGIAFRPEHAERFGEDGADGDVAATLEAAAADPALRLANRNPASGTYALLEEVLAGIEPRPPGWATGYPTHQGVAAAVVQGRADYGVCLEGPARAVGLHWRPLRDERYDFLVPTDRWDGPGARAFRAVLDDPEVRRELEALGLRR